MATSINPRNYIQQVKIIKKKIQQLEDNLKELQEMVYKYKPNEDAMRLVKPKELKIGLVFWARQPCLHWAVVEQISSDKQYVWYMNHRYHIDEMYFEICNS